MGVGGSTSCVAIAGDGGVPTLVLDAGTGLNNVTSLLGGRPFQGTIVLGHLHWDHVIGLPFFAAGDRPDAEVRVLIPEQGMDPLATLSRMMSPPLFPITPTELLGDWTFGSYDEGTFVAGGFTVRAREIPHTGGRTMGLRISDGTHTIAYLSDHSPQSLGPGADGLGLVHEAAMDLARDVDLLIHDAEYTADELVAKGTWGHAAAQYCLTLADACNARRVQLFHHDPSRTDAQLIAMRDDLAASNRVRVEIACEGDTIVL